MKNRLLLSIFIFSLTVPFCIINGQNKKINVIVIGAHPDDPDGSTGGTAILFSQMGHNVLFVSMTNGDAGHQSTGGGALAKRRRTEAQEAGKRFGVTYKVLDNHDGELMPTLENRKEIIRLIREWNADIVIGPRPYDYHPDHRNTAILIQDAAYLVIVPNIVSDTPPLKSNPVFLYTQDRFKKPYSFIPDIAIDITNVIDQKIFAMSAHESQYFEWLPWTSSQSVPENEADRLKWLKSNRNRVVSPEIRESLIRWYGSVKGNYVSSAEAFEICEYGKQPDEQGIRELFPMIK